VPEPENSNSTTQTTLAQLLNIDSQLSIQEAQLLAQLESIQEKRQSLQIVINLFAEADKTPVVATMEEKILTPQAQTERESHTVVEPEPKTTSIEPPTYPEPKKEKKTVSSKKSPPRKTKSSKTAKQIPGWQHYLRDEFWNSSLPQAISSVLRSQADRVWDIAAVTEAIFVEEIPQEVKKKVRLQITNLLAQGVRENKWYRGQQGSYTLSKKAAVAQTR